MHLAYAAVRAQRALDDANHMILRREARRRQFDGDIEQAKTAGREASYVVKRALQALAQSVASALAGATAAPSPSTRPQGVASQPPRPGDYAFFKGSVARMRSATGVDPHLSVGDRGGGSGLRSPHVREAGIAARERLFSGSDLGSHGLYRLCKTDESRLDPCPRQDPPNSP